MIERIIRIGFIKQIDETVNDTVNVQYRTPVLAQNVETHLALQINIGMVYLGRTFDLGW